MITKTITITERHAEWCKKHFINLSRFVQAKLEEEIKNGSA